MNCDNCGHEIRKSALDGKWYHWDNKMQDWAIECSQRIEHTKVFCECRMPEPETRMKCDVCGARYNKKTYKGSGECLACFEGLVCDEK